MWPSSTEGLPSDTAGAGRPCSTDREARHRRPRCPPVDDSLRAIAAVGRRPVRSREHFRASRSFAFPGDERKSSPGDASVAARSPTANRRNVSSAAFSDGAHELSWRPTSWTNRSPVFSAGPSLFRDRHDRTLRPSGRVLAILLVHERTLGADQQKSWSLATSAATYVENSPLSHGGWNMTPFGSSMTYSHTASGSSGSSASSQR